jgi:hypothetical protein
MQRRILLILLLSTLFVAFVGATVFATSRDTSKGIWKQRAELTMNSKAKLAGAEKFSGQVPSTSAQQSIGFDEIKSASPGRIIGTSTYDLQSNCRMNRQIEWRATQKVHIIWMRADNRDEASLDRGTAYQAWNETNATFHFASYPAAPAGCDLHPRLGPGVNYSGYVSLDVDTEGKAVIANHHDNGSGYASTVWYDFGPANCFFAPYTRRVPDSLMQCCNSPEDVALGDWEMIWPSHEYQVWDGDTVTHVFSQQFEDKDPETSVICYFRRVGSDTLGTWDWPCMTVDTVPTISQIVTSSRVSGKVALVWQAPPGKYPGDPESLGRDWVDPGLGVNQRTNDIFYMISPDMGASWGPKINLTKFDSTKGGWLGHGEMSCLYDMADHLHILWPAREIEPAPAGLGEYVHFWGARLFHWDDLHNVTTTVKDANWAIQDAWADTFCVGGAWNEMSIEKCMLSECDNKFYAVFVLFQDVYNGIYNDCAKVRFTDNDWDGTANGELYVSVSDNGGLNWDLARNLTNTPTPYCDTLPLGAGECESDHYPSMPRYGMHVTTGDFTGIPIVDPSGSYSGSYFLDVFYVDDKFPGSCMQDRGVWTTNPFKWFRLACVNPVPSPILAYTPSEIGPPAWTKPGIPYVDTGTWENVGNANLTVDSVRVLHPTNTVIAGGPGVYVPGGKQTVVITITSSTYGIFRDTAKIYSNSVTGSLQRIPIELIIADTVQFPEERDIRTDCKRICFNNAGNIGSQAGYDGNGGYNMNFFDDCDTTNNKSGADDQAKVYLYDASPFVSYIKGNDTILNYAMYDASWLSDYGFRPLVGSYADSTTYPDYQYGYSGKFLTKDSLIAIEVEYFAPTHPDTCSFIVLKQRFYRNTTTTVNNVYLGELMDWDIPSDSGSRNGSDYDTGKKLMYCYGAEYAPDSIANQDCVLADDRCGGFAYGVGYKLPAGDSIGDPKAMWTENNGTYVYPENAFVAGQMYKLFVNKTGYSTWQPPSPESLYTDLHMVCVYGKWNIGASDTLVFCKIISSEYNGGAEGLKATIDKARIWISHHPEICPRPPVHACDCRPGDPNNNTVINILDITYLINFVYKGGPAPIPYALCSGDPNGNCVINILDITYLINFVYKGGPAPVTCEQWLVNCGAPLRN